MGATSSLPKRHSCSELASNSTGICLRPKCERTLTWPHPRGLDPACTKRNSNESNTSNTSSRSNDNKATNGTIIKKKPCGAPCVIKRTFEEMQLPTLRFRSGSSSTVSTTTSSNKSSNNTYDRSNKNYKRGNNSPIIAKKKPCGAPCVIKKTLEEMQLPSLRRFRRRPDVVLEDAEATFDDAPPIVPEDLPEDGHIEDSTSGKPFDKLYKMGNELGTGTFAVVKEAYHRQSCDHFAVKIVKKTGLSQGDELALKDEISVLKELDGHPNIIRLYDVFDERRHFYLITEMMTGGELFDRVGKKSYYTEKEARDACLMLFDAIDYCHTRKIAHRDLKPENLLLTSDMDDCDIKLADFGLAKKCHAPKSLKTQCGTPSYIAPEILKGADYDTQADMWSLGVIVFILLGGYRPFNEQRQGALFRKIKRGEYEFNKKYWKNVSYAAKQMIKSLLTVDPDHRATAKSVLESEWIIHYDDDELSSYDLSCNLDGFKDLKDDLDCETCASF